MNLSVIAVSIAVVVCGVMTYAGYDYGYNKAKAEQIGSYEQSIKTLEAKAKDALNKERNAYAQQEQIEADYLEKIEELKRNEDDLINQYRTNTLSLRDSLKPKQCSDVPPTTSSTSDSHAKTTGGLHDTDVEFLVRIANRADAVAEQLEEAQQIILNDREVCNVSE